MAGPDSPPNVVAIFGLRERTSMAPDLPTVTELGYPQFTVDFFYGMFAPVGTPAPIVKRLREGVAAVLNDPAIPVRLRSQGLEPLDLAETARRLPVRDRGDLLLGDAEGAERLAVLGEHELARGREAGAGLRELAQRGIEPPLRALVETEALHRVLEHVGHEREHGPPVAARSPARNTPVPPAGTDSAAETHSSCSTRL